MLKKLQQKLKDRKRQKELEHLRNLMIPKTPRRPAAKCAKRR